MAKERIQKILARAGIASRRKAEELIAEGLVSVNGKLAHLGDQADTTKDAIKVRGKLLQTKIPVQNLYFAFYKPRGVISMFHDPQNRETLQDYFDKYKSHLFPVGRLDFNSDGLLLITNDGGFAEKMQTNKQVLRIYRVKVKGHVTDADIAVLKKGAFVQNRRIRPHAVSFAERLESKSVIQIAIRGGGNVDVKSLVQARGFLVDRITRYAIGHITVGDLKPGQFRVLSDTQIEALFAQPELGQKLIATTAKPKASPSRPKPVISQPRVISNRPKPKKFVHN